MRPSTSSAVNAASPWRHLGGWRLREVWYAPGVAQPRHRHREPSLSLVLSGELDETSSGGSYRAAAGSLVILAPTIIVFVIFQRQFVSALLQGSLKG